MTTVRPLFERIDSLCDGIELKTKTLVSNFEKLSGALREVDAARQKIQRACDGDADNVPVAIDEATELEAGAVDNLTTVLLACATGVDDFQSFMARDIQHEFDEIRNIAIRK